MQQTPNIDLLKNQIEQHVKDFNQGLFITIDTQFSQNPTSKKKVVRDGDGSYHIHSNNKQIPRIDDRRLYDFTNKNLNELCNRTHRYCFGRSYAGKGNRLKTISSIEIGKDRQRLHAHCIMLHQGDTDRTYEQMCDSVIQNCKWIFNITGENAYKVEAFEPDRFWASYFIKETKKMFRLYDGFMNIDLH